MASIAEPMRRSPFPSSPRSYTPQPGRALPVLSVNNNKSPSADEGDPMDVSQQSASTTGSMGPPPNSHDIRSHERASSPAQRSDQMSQAGDSVNGSQREPVGAAAAAQQPKIVQTAFIHKLYNMLEDQSIQHLISWSSTNESFVMSPSSEFSKVLAQYFKHTNISSFVRQLNMYGFHKVSDVFHTGSPDSPLWEFKHGAGNFKRGDLVGLREIKRRASRHALINRDSFSSTPKIPPPPPPPPQIPGPMMETNPPDSLEARMNQLEYNQSDLYHRLSRSEDAHAAATARCHTLLDGLSRCHNWTKELTSTMSMVVPNHDHKIHKDLTSMQQEIMRSLDSLRTLEDSHDPFINRSLYPPGLHESGMSVSPRQRPYDESRRPSLQSLGKPVSFRPALPNHVQASPRRFGSIGTANGAYSPTMNSRISYALPPPPIPANQPSQHPLARTQSPPPNLPRRHTSADIRSQGWQAGQSGSSPYASGQNSTAWPSSPRAPPADQHLQDTLDRYELSRPSNSRQTTPPAAPDAPTFTNSFASSTASYANNGNEAGWQLPGPKFPFRSLDTPGPPTRRSSMASNVHSLLNPADTAEKDGEDEEQDDRKRKRIV